MNTLTNIETIPEWTSDGLLPPIRPSEGPTSSDRSPYRCSLESFIKRFATTTERCEILQGFLAYRSFLREIEITEGFQWVNGSFSEDKERLQGCAPNDVDIVTFFKQPLGLTQSSLTPEQRGWLSDPDKAKEKFSVHAYIAPLGQALDNTGVREISYYYSLWSHTREDQWKGFLEIPLKAGADDQELALLTQIKATL